MRMLSPSEIKALLSGQCITELHPWVEQDGAAIEAMYKLACSTIEWTSNVKSRIEWDNYGSGYASYIDAWFYRPSPDFQVSNPLKFESEYKGLVVLLSRLAPYFAFMEGEKRWNAHTASSYMPTLEAIDDLRNPAIQELALAVQASLESFGLTRVSKAELSMPLPSGVSVVTNLTDRGNTQFDALFHWDD